MSRIAFISTMAANPWGGSEELWVEMANKAQKNGHNVFVSVYRWKQIEKRILSLKQNGIQLDFRRRLAYQSFTGKIKGKITQITFAEKELSNFVFKAQPDEIIISMGSFADLEIDPFRKFLLKTSIPYKLIVHVNMESHSIASHKIKEVRDCCQKAKQVLFVSIRLKEIAERQIANKFTNAEIIANPVNMNELGVVSFPTLNEVQFAIVGRLIVNVKGQALLLQILSSDKWLLRDWHLNIYGEGPDKDLIVDLINLYELKDRITLHGQVKNIREDIWSKNQLLLMPSYYEGMPLVLMEAMLSGRTSVVSDVGGASELIEHEVDGFIAEGNTTFSFDKALDDAWENKGRWKEMGEVAFDKANNYFNQHSMEKLFPNLFNAK